MKKIKQEFGGLFFELLAVFAYMLSIFGITFLMMR